jgi:multiple sugar transport system substrate-binding protein
MPTYNGKVGGRIDADTFRLLKSSKNPQAAFTAMAYLETTGIQKLIIGSANNPPAYGAVPAIAADRQPFLDAKKVQFPWVKNLDTLMAGLQYPDVPSAEGFVPNFNDAWDRNTKFGNLITTTGGLNLANEITTLETDLATIYNK